MKAASLLLSLVLMCTAVHYASSAITCETFDELVAGTVYSNSTGYTPGTGVTSNTYRTYRASCRIVSYRIVDCRHVSCDHNHIYALICMCVCTKCVASRASAIRHALVE